MTVRDIESLSRRRDVLTFLRDPAPKAEMVEDLDHSRSTVDRAVRTLEDAGFVDLSRDGYVTTQTGQLALEQYESFLEETQTVLDASSVLNALPVTVDLPLSLVTTASVDAVDSEYRLFEVLAEELTAAERYRAVLPRIADTRHVRLLHSRVVEDGLDATVLAPEAVYRQLTDEFPYLASDLAEADTVQTRETPTGELGVVLTDREQETSTVIPIYDGKDVVGVLRTTDEEAIKWVREHVAEIAADAEPTTHLGGEQATIPELAGRGLPASLRSAGFDRVDETYFENREAVDPVTAWRAGVALPEVAAGYAIERTRADDGREPFTAQLQALLDAGEDVAVIGPPGSGKSTVCKQVAYEWFDSQLGPVLYRESGQARPYERDDTLEQVLEGADGRALVVVEDAVRPEANDVFDVLAAYSDSDDVAFLIDSRQTEWNEPEDRPADVEAARDIVETARMPPFDEHEQRTVLERFEKVTDRTVPADELVGSPADRSGAQDSPTGDVFVFFHRLTRYADPIADDAGVTTLDEHVDRLRATLESGGDGVLDIGVLANALNAAGIGLTPEYLHAVSDVDADVVEQAIDFLSGEVLFETAAGDLRTVHDSWSVRFLERWLDAAGPADAHARFGRVLTDLLAVADDADQRAEVAETVEGRPERLAAIARDPGEWADDVTAQLFELGTSYPKLGQLFGTTDESALALSAACSEEIELRQRAWRGYMFNWAGQFDRAEAEFAWLAESLPDPAETEVDDLRGGLFARAHLGLMRASYADDPDATSEHGERALAAYDAVGDVRGIVETRYELQSVVTETGDAKDGLEYRQQTLETAESTGDETLIARALYGLGQYYGLVGDTEAASDYMERGYETAREAGATRAEKQASVNLASLSGRMGDIDTADRYARRSIDLSRRLGDTHNRITALIVLGWCAIRRGDLDAAETAVSKASREAEDGSFVNIQLSVERISAWVDWIDTGSRDAIERLESLVERTEESGMGRSEGQTRARLALALAETDEIDAARRHAERALAIGEELGSSEIVSVAGRALGQIARRQGALEEAAERLEDALVTAEEASYRIHAAKARAALAGVARDRGDDDLARERYETAIETLRSCGAIRDALGVVDELAAIADDPGEWYETGAEIAADGDLTERAAAYRERDAESEQGERRTTD